MTLRRREHFRHFLANCFVAELPQKKKCFHAQEFTRFLSNWCRLSIDAHTLTCPFKQSNLSAWSLLSWDPTHTHLWVRLFQKCLLSTVMVTPRDLDYVNRSAAHQQFRLIYTSTIAGTIFCIRTTGCIHTRQSPYKIVGDCSDEGVSLLCQGPRRRETRRNSVEMETNKDREKMLFIG